MLPSKRRKPKLGSHLEWHGAIIRVVVKVPPSRRKAVGSAHLKESLGTASPTAAETLKWPVIERLKARAKGSPQTKAIETLTAEAMKWRETVAAKPRFTPAEKWVEPNALDERTYEIEDQHGAEVATRFYATASGQSTPLTLHIDRWLSEASIAPRTMDKWRKSVSMLEAWAAEGGSSGLTIEEIDHPTAADFISERMTKTGMHPGTANSYLTGLRAYWTWLVNRKSAKFNPWKGLSRPKAKASDPSGDKRHFTDDEVLTLLGGIEKQPLRDLCLIAALSGMRMNEIAALRVSDINGDMIRLRAGKTKSARRLIPIHPELTDLFAARMKGKASDAFILHELTNQKNAARPRGAPMTQAFTYARRDLGVDERVEGVRQSNIDFHSFRRWFIRKTADALEAGATGFNQWTIAEVVGHSRGDGPLTMTMGRYAGDTAPETLRRCVESVKLPT